MKLEILGPETAGAGEEIAYSIKFKNNGKALLEEPELVFEYPENSLPVIAQTESQEGQEFNRTTQKLDSIYPGEERTVEFKARVFGKQGDLLKAQAWLTYRPKNIKAKYESKTSFSSQISNVPVNFEFDLPLKAENGETLQFSLNYFSNIGYALENLRVKMQYPNGFLFDSAKPQALDETEWSLPALYQVDGGRITVKGTIEGSEGEQKIFRAQLGVIINNKFIVLTETSRAVEMAEPSFYVSCLVNGAQNYTANSGDLLHYEVFFKNIGKKPIQKQFLLVKLDGDFFDLETIKTEQGEAGRGDNSVLWDWKNVQDLKFLDAGDEGKVDFWVKVKEPSLGQKIKNPVLKAVISIAGAEKVVETQINSQVELSQKVFREEEVFGNKGPIPPQVGASTTYTVFWQIKNSWNTLENVKVKGSLPSYAKPTGNIFPSDAKLTFDSASRELIWTIGSLEAFQGLSETTPFSLAFQIEVIPLASQRGQTITLINNVEISGEDVFTLDVVSATAPAIASGLPDDDTISEQQGVVQ